MTTDATLDVEQSAALFNKAQECIPGGVNSPVRAFGAVGGTPRFMQSAQGAYITDVDGNRYVDYIGSWGPMILGHNDPDVVSAAIQAAQRGMSFGAPCAAEVELAEMIVDLIPSIDKVRMVNSGTEATMSAIRLARGYTKRDKFIKFEGCYHGHADSLLVKSGSGTLTFGVPTSPGVPGPTVADTLVATFNDLDSVQSLFSEYPDQIAAIIVEPIAGNMNLVKPQPGFLEGLRSLCTQHGTVLIFDEVMTGFRVSLTGAQGMYGITPDLTTFGKIIGGGMPVGAYGGRQDIMDCISPMGPVYQAGTLSGNPVAMAAGLANLKKLTEADFYKRLAAKTESFVSSMQSTAKEYGLPLHVSHVPGMFGLFFTDKNEATNFKAVCECDKDKFNQFFHGMLERGIYFAPSAFEAGFISIQHDEKSNQVTAAALADWLGSVS